jgi:broad specificity phosphatase PhoE
MHRQKVDTEAYIQWHLRHGESDGNIGPGFGGGHPDDTEAGPIELTALGKSQADASGLAAAKLGLRIGDIFTSQLVRATTTADRFISAYASPEVSQYEQLAALHEVHHGSAERGMPRASREMIGERYKKNVQILGKLLTESIGEDCGKYAGWVTPTGLGDGESYLEAALRISGAIDEQGRSSNALFVGHNGGLRQARVLSSYLSREERNELAEQFSATAGVRQEMREAITSAYTMGKELTDKDLSNIFGLGTAAVSETAKILHAAKLALVEEVIGKQRRIGNGQFVEVKIEASGKWTILRRLIPVFSKEAKALNSQNVHIDILPFGIASASGPTWW